MLCAERAGGLVAGWRWIQRPFQAHVSSLAWETPVAPSGAPRPPKRMDTCAFSSYAMRATERMEGKLAKALVAESSSAATHRNSRFGERPLIREDASFR